MFKQVHDVPGSPTRLPTWSQAVEVNGIVFLAGQSGEDPATGKMAAGGIEAETRQVLENIGNVLSSLGLGFGDVVSVTTYLSDIEDFEAYDAIYAEYFTVQPPARATVEARLVPPYRIEIQSIACRPSKP